MKCWLAILIALVPAVGFGQGAFLPANPTASTRIGSIDGPYASSGIWGQFLVGTNTDSLTPVGIALQHGGSGHVFGDIVIVPGIPGGTFGYVQMVAWDGTRWGTSLSGVPLDQLGLTDVVQHFFTFDFQPQSAPLFTQPAVVPIPEPSVFALSTLALCATWLGRLTQRQKKAACVYAASANSNSD